MARNDPVALHNKWIIRQDWQLLYIYTSNSTGNARYKKLGQICHISYTGNGVVNGNSRVPVVSFRTSAQPKNALPYGMQLKMGDWEQLQIPDRNSLPTAKERKSQTMATIARE